MQQPAALAYQPMAVMARNESNGVITMPANQLFIGEI
jgi:hypothetical protein